MIKTRGGRHVWQNAARGRSRSKLGKLRTDKIESLGPPGREAFTHFCSGLYPSATHNSEEQKIKRDTLKIEAPSVIS